MNIKHVYETGKISEQFIGEPVVSYDSATFHGKKFDTMQIDLNEKKIFFLNWNADEQKCEGISIDITEMEIKADEKKISGYQGA